MRERMLRRDGGPGDVGRGTVATRLVATAGLALVFLTVPGVVSAQAPDGPVGVELCEGAERFVREVAGMIAVSEPDTIDDWRTRAMVPGCRVTAAGATTRAYASEVQRFYEMVREVGWGRTPDPRDAPNEASLRFRRDGADCLFNFYTPSTALNTEAELIVSDALPRQPGDRMYNFVVLCTPEAPAAPRGGS